MFLVPAKRENKINSFRKWEQAFRLYASIYCDKNLFRTKEILQYITVIETAASAYVWENVYNYDIIFRQLMAFNPNRSWAVLYSQMWNLPMCEPLNKIKQFGNSSSYSCNNSNNHTSSKGGVRRKSGNKSDYCWNFNKGVKCKFGKSCKFIERCSFCDSPNHGIHVCQKFEKSTGAAASGGVGMAGGQGAGNAVTKN